jgi:hypothetical protein
MAAVFRDNRLAPELEAEIWIYNEANIHMSNCGSRLDLSRNMETSSLVDADVRDDLREASEVFVFEARVSGTVMALDTVL